MMFSWIFILAICIWAVCYYGNKKDFFSNKMPNNTPLELLKRRFAKGEITEEENDEKRAVLEEDKYLNSNP